MTALDPSIPKGIICAECNRIRPHRARGLCQPCYDWLIRQPDRDERHLPTRWPREELLAEVAWLREQGETDRHRIAARCGVTVRAIYSAQHRARVAAA